MSIRDLNKQIIVSDCLNGQIVTTIDLGLYDKRTCLAMLQNIIYNDFENEHGIMIKFGYKN